MRHQSLWSTHVLSSYSLVLVFNYHTVWQWETYNVLISAQNITHKKMLNEIWEHYLIVHKRLHQRPKYSHLFVQFFLFFCVNHFAFTFSSLRRSVLPTKSCQTPKRRSFTTDMANRVYGREEGEGPAWTISSPIFLVGGCLVSWGGRAEDEMEERGEARTWCILWSKCAFLWQIVDALRCSDIYWYILSYRVSLEDLYNGKTTKLQLSKNVICGACNG